jgi:hypothetical protein
MAQWLKTMGARGDHEGVSATCGAGKDLTLLRPVPSGATVKSAVVADVDDG